MRGEVSQLKLNNGVYFCYYGIELILFIVVNWIEFFYKKK